MIELIDTTNKYTILTLLLDKNYINLSNSDIVFIDKYVYNYSLRYHKLYIVLNNSEDILYELFKNNISFNSNYKISYNMNTISEAKKIRKFIMFIKSGKYFNIFTPKTCLNFLYLINCGNLIKTSCPMYLQEHYYNSVIQPFICNFRLIGDTSTIISKCKGNDYYGYCDDCGAIGRYGCKCSYNEQMNQIKGATKNIVDHSYLIPELVEYIMNPIIWKYNLNDNISDFNIYLLAYYCLTNKMVFNKVYYNSVSLYNICRILYQLYIFTRDNNYTELIDIIMTTYIPEYYIESIAETKLLYRYNGHHLKFIFYVTGEFKELEEFYYNTLYSKLNLTMVCENEFCKYYKKYTNYL